MKFTFRVRVILFLLAVPVLVFSQFHMDPGYIVNLNNDTIQGEGYVSQNQRFCIFRQFNLPTPLRYRAEEIKSIRFTDGKYYASKEILTRKTMIIPFVSEYRYERKDNYLLEFLVDGEVDLLLLKEPGYFRFFIENPRYPVREFKYSKDILEKDGKKYNYIDPIYKGYLKVYMADAPKVCEKINSLDFINQKILINLSEEYHHEVCNSDDCINYSKRIFGQRKKSKDESGNNIQ